MLSTAIDRLLASDPSQGASFVEVPRMLAEIGCGCAYLVGASVSGSPQGRFPASPQQLYLGLIRIAQTAHEIAQKYVELRRQVVEVMRGDARSDTNRVAELADAVEQQVAAAEALRAFLIALLAILLAILSWLRSRERVRWAAAKSSEYQRDWSWRSCVSYCAAFDATPA